ncbi:unnamed protein product [Cochlearia groenlandica]
MSFVATICLIGPPKKEPGETSTTTASVTEAANDKLGEIEGIHQVLGRLVLNGSSKIACLYTQQRKKGTNQDVMLVFDF